MMVPLDHLMQREKKDLLQLNPRSSRTEFCCASNTPKQTRYCATRHGTDGRFVPKFLSHRWKRHVQSTTSGCLGVRESLRSTIYLTVGPLDSPRRFWLLMIFP
jgi:hypothetical protein